MVALRGHSLYNPDEIVLGNESFGAMLFGTHEEQLFVNPAFGARVCHAVDQVEGMSGLGVMLMTIGRDTAWGPNSTAMWGKATLRNPARAGLAKVIVALGPPPSQPPIIPGPNATQRLLRESFSALFSCGGAACCWAGVLGGGFLAPETGGASALVAIYLSTAAVGASVQCVESVSRMIIAVTPQGASSLKKLDDIKWLKQVNTGLDIYVLFGGMLVLKETLLAFAAARDAGTDVPLFLKGKLTRDQARKFYENVLANGSREAVAVTSALKRQLVDYVGVALGIAGSARDDAGAVSRSYDALRKALNYRPGETLQATVAIVQ